MIKQQLIPGKWPVMIVALMMLFAALSGCASDKAVDESAAEIRRITDIIIDENSESVNVIVKANKYLLYSSLTYGPR
jgi:type IV pilus biogenesis protein CpaD/CtpE